MKRECILCGRLIKPGDPYWERKYRGRWAFIHFNHFAVTNRKWGYVI